MNKSTTAVSNLALSAVLGMALSMSLTNCVDGADLYFTLLLSVSYILYFIWPFCLPVTCRTTDPSLDNTSFMNLSRPLFVSNIRNTSSVEFVSGLNAAKASLYLPDRVSAKYGSLRPFSISL